MLMTQSNESLEVIIMSRPKGSKNKKTIIKNSNLGEQITQKETARASLEEEKARLLSVIAESNAKLKAVNKDIRALDKQITALQAKKAEFDAAAIVSEKQHEIQSKIQKLVAEGKSLDDILDMLN